MSGIVSLLRVMTIFSKHFVTIGVSATGQKSLRHVTVLFFGMCTVMVDLKQMDRGLQEGRDQFNKSVNTSASSDEQTLIAYAEMLSWPATFRCSLQSLTHIQ